MQYRAFPIILGMAVGSALCCAQIADYRASTLQNSETVVLPSIAGIVTAMDGSPLHDIRIEVHPLGTGALLQTCLSNLNGSFNVTNLRPGHYEIVAVDGVKQVREQVFLESGIATLTLRMPGPSATATKGTISVARLRTPEKAQRLVEKARTDINKKHPEEARKHVESALAIAPDYPDALTIHAVLEFDTNQTQSAVDDLDRAIKADPGYGPAYLVLGAVFNQLGRFDEALRTLDRSAMFDPKSWQCAFEMSKAWLGKHDYERALRELNRAQAMGGTRMIGPIHILRGYALMGQKHFDEATSELEAYLSAEPNGQLAGSVRAALAQIKTVMSQKADTVELPAISGFFGSAN